MIDACMELEMRPEMWLSSAGVGLAVRRSKSLRLQWRLLGAN